LGNYAFKADWYNLDWHPRDWFGIRAGRVKLPFGLYNNTSDIDSARVPVLLPQSIYPAENRDTLLAATGLEIYGRYGPLEYSLYGGAVFIDPFNDTLGRINAEILTINEPYLIGGRLMYEAPLAGLRLGFSLQGGSIGEVQENPSSEIATTTTFTYQWVASLEYARRDLLLAVEYSRWFTLVETTNTLVVPEDPGTTSERGYLMLTYRFTPWFWPGFYYSFLFLNVDHRSNLAMQQQDLSFTARFDINEYWLIKLEGHFMVGTGSLSPVLNDGRTREQLAPFWGACFVKTTAHF
jgi:hypothetical protein